MAPVGRIRAPGPAYPFPTLSDETKLGDFKTIYAFDPNFMYDSKMVKAIETNRRKLDGELFFDKIMKQFVRHEFVAPCYPPKDKDTFIFFLKDVGEFSAPDYYKQALIYYLLLDVKSHPEAPERFARDCFLPEKYATYMEGLWYMDHLQFQKAIERLTQPAIAVDFPDAILQTLLKHAPANDLSLVMAYYHTVSPILNTPQSLEPLFVAICRLSVSEAFHFARHRMNSGHQHLFEQLVSFVLSQPPGAERAQQCVDLINQPFSSEEEEWFEQYLTQGKGRNLSGATDSLTMRRIATGNYSAAVGDGKGPSGRSVDGVHWGALKEGLKRGMGPRMSLEGSAKSSR